MADDQTHRQWLNIPNVAGARGTAVFKRTSSSSKEFLDNVEYHVVSDIAEREDWDTFSWVPHQVASENQVHSAPCSGRCVPGSCSPGCICGRATGICE
jgi:hypothetical protein